MKTYCKHLIFMTFTTRSISCSQFSPVSPHTAFSLFQATWNVLCRTEGFHFSASWYPWIIFDIWFEWHCKPKCQKGDEFLFICSWRWATKACSKQFFNLIPPARLLRQWYKAFKWHLLEKVNQLWIQFGHGTITAIFLYFGYRFLLFSNLPR